MIAMCTLQTMQGMRGFAVVWALCGALAAHGQTDDTFWFVAPEVTSLHGDFPVLLRFATFDAAATVTVDQPANAAFPPQTLAIPPSSAASLDLTPWLAAVENAPFDQVLNKGLRIVSTAPVSAYYEVNPSCGCNPDIFVLKGENALGTSFFIPSQNYLVNAHASSPGGFDIVATEPNTSITITPTQALIGHPAGVPFTVVLPFAGSTYSARAASTAAAAHPTGTVVTSTKPVAITLHDDSLFGAPFNGGCLDLTGDQIVPVPVVGREYIAIRGYLNTNTDRLFVVATAPGTQVSIGGVPVATLGTGQWYMHILAAPVALIEATQDVYVWHLTGFGCEVGAAILPSTECTGSESVVFVRSTGEFLGINLLVPTGAEDAFLFNGVAGSIPASAFAPVPGSGGAWMYAQITGTGFVPQLDASRITNTEDFFHLGIIHGGAATGCRYGYFSDYGERSYQASAEDLTVCAGDALAIDVAPVENGLYQWTGPAGYSATGQSVAVGTATAALAGSYVVSGWTGTCPIASDTVDVTVLPVGTASLSASICDGSTYPFNGALLDASGTYTTALTTAQGCDSTLTLALTVHPSPELTFSATTCPETPYAFEGNFYAANGIYPVTYTTAFGCDSVRTLELTVSEPIETSFNVTACDSWTWNGQAYTASDNLVSTFTAANGCDSTVTVALTVESSTFFSEEVALCPGEFHTLPDGTSVTAAGTYTTTVPSPTTGCPSTTTTEVALLQAFSSSTSVLLCAGDVHVLPNGSPVSTPGAYTTPLVSVLTGCDSTVVTTVVEAPRPAVNFFWTPVPVDALDPEVAFVNTTTGAAECTWSLSTLGASSVWNPEVQFPEMETGEHVICLACTSVQGCPAEACAVLVIEGDVTFFVPTAFTPDGDGLNEVLAPVMTGGGTAGYRFTVVDRWGTTVFETEDPEGFWNGSVQGGAHFAPDGLYLWRAVVSSAFGPERFEFMGNVLLMR